jgi:hypothetical protein
MSTGDFVPPPEAVPDSPVREVRFSLPQMLRELQLERSGSVFAREILDQMEISQMFATRRKKHDKRRK